MKSIVITVCLTLVTVLFLAVSPLQQLPRLLEGRSGSELSLFLTLNGERSRVLQTDGGGSLLWVADGGIGSFAITGGLVYYLENVGTVVCHLCNPGPDQLTWDGGCNSTPSDPNYGFPVPVGGYRWISTRDGTTTLKAVSGSGATATTGCTMPVAIMR